MYWLIFISFILLNYKVASKLSNKHFEEILILGFLIYSSSIIISGYFLSYVNLWNSKILWSIIPFFTTYCIYLFFKRPSLIEENSGISAFKVTGKTIQSIHEEFLALKPMEKWIFRLMFYAVFIITVLQYTLLFNSPPNEWDSMTGHLNRILYFLQEGSLSHFIGTNWNIDTYPKSFCSIQVYPFIMSGYNEHMFKLPNFGAYWLICFSMYGILKQIGVSYKPRLFVSILILLVPIIISQSILTDTDIVLGAYLSSLIYALLRYEQSKSIIYIYWAALGLALALSHKITFVFSIPPLALFYLYIIFQEQIKTRLRLIKHVFISHGIAVIFLTLSTGYLSNIYYYGHPIGPKTATYHQSIERAGSVKNLMIQGSRNVVRYGFDLLNFDGLRNIIWVENQQKKVKSALKKVDTSFQLGLEGESDFTIIPFTFNRRFEFYNGTPIYGGIFILFVIPALFLFIKKPKPIFALFLAAFVLHFLALAYTAAYDPWKGRYMISSAIFLFPLLAYVGDWFVKSDLTFSSKLYFFISTCIICVSGIMTIALNIRALPFDAYGQKSIFKSSRMELLTISRPDITKAYQNFDLIVPQNAVVALATINDDYEYPLWGKKFTRHLIPINPFDQGLQKIPQNADYLFFAKTLIKPQNGDIRLGTDLSKNDLLVKGEDYYLRKLH